MSADRLQNAIDAKKNPSVLGLDPQPGHIPPGIMERHVSERGKTLDALAAAYREVNFTLIDCLCDVVPAVKLQCACYEAAGGAGMEVFGRTIEYARERGLYVIADGKRGDIGSSSGAYSAAFLGRTDVLGEKLPVFDADALTVNPYLGSDSLAPFLEDCEKYGKMVFVLCRTSNRSSAEVQELIAGDRPLYRVIAEQAWRQSAKTAGEYGFAAAGVVVGATQPYQIKTLREDYPGLFFLVPGYGAQGGRAEDLVFAFDRFGRGAVVNNSRGICCAWQKSGKSLTDAAREAAIAMRDALRKAMRSA